MKNYHTHTTRCYHATGTEEEYILSAIKAGYTELGFSDHTPWHYDSSYHSTMRMEETSLDDYVDTLLRLKEKYKEQISIKIGLECEYFPQYMEWLKAILKKYSIDYIILGNHFENTDETGIYYGSPLTKEQLTSYVDSSIAAMKTSLYSYLAHPDLANYDENDEFYAQEMMRLCIVAKELDIPLELNLLGFSTKRHYPNVLFFVIAKKVGNRIIIGTDAHESKALLDQEIYDTAYDFIHDFGLLFTEDIKFLR